MIAQRDDGDVQLRCDRVQIVTDRSGTRLSATTAAPDQTGNRYNGQYNANYQLQLATTSPTRAIMNNKQPSAQLRLSEQQQLSAQRGYYQPNRTISNTNYQLSHNYQTNDQNN